VCKDSYPTFLERMKKGGKEASEIKGRTEGEHWGRAEQAERKGEGWISSRFSNERAGGEKTPGGGQRGGEGRLNVSDAGGCEVQRGGAW